MIIYLSAAWLLTVGSGSSPETSQLQIRCRGCVVVGNGLGGGPGVLLLLEWRGFSPGGALQ